MNDALAVGVAFCAAVVAIRVVRTSMQLRQPLIVLAARTPARVTAIYSYDRGSAVPDATTTPLLDDSRGHEGIAIAVAG